MLCIGDNVIIPADVQQTQRYSLSGVVRISTAEHGGNHIEEAVYCNRKSIHNLYYAQSSFSLVQQHAVLRQNSFQLELKFNQPRKIQIFARLQLWPR